MNRVEQFPSIPQRSLLKRWIRPFRELDDLVRAYSEVVQVYNRSRPVLNDEYVWIQICLALSYLIDFQPH